MEAGVTTAVTAHGRAAYFSYWVGKGPPFSVFDHTVPTLNEAPDWMLPPGWRQAALPARWQDPLLPWNEKRVSAPSEASPDGQRPGATHGRCSVALGGCLDKTS